MVEPYPETIRAATAAARACRPRLPPGRLNRPHDPGGTIAAAHGMFIA